MDTSRTAPALCPSVEGAFNLLSRKWTGLLVFSLADAPRRFCEVQKAVPNVSARVLASRMRELESEGIVARTVDTGTPVRVTYALTDKGRALVPVVRGIETWARAWTAPAARKRR